MERKAEGYRSRRQEALEKALRDREEAERALREDVMKCRPFRVWLASLADRYGYLATPSERCPYDQGANDAIRNLVNGFVNGTSMGASWLGEYAGRNYRETGK